MSGGRCSRGRSWGGGRTSSRRKLAANEAKGARERLTLVRIFEELRERGYDGGYDAVRRYTKQWRKARGKAEAEAYVPLSFAPGEAYQFDCSHEVVVMNGQTLTVQVAHVRLCHSRMLFVRAYPRETQEMVFDAHDRAFAFFRGACRLHARECGIITRPDDGVPRFALPGAVTSVTLVRLGRLEHELDLDGLKRKLDTTVRSSVEQARVEQSPHVRVYGLDITPDATRGFADRHAACATESLE